MNIRRILAGIFGIPIFFFGIIGNLLVVVSVWKKRSLRSTTNYLLVNLAVSDVTSLIFTILALTQGKFLKTKGILADILCKVFLSYNVPVFASLVSILTLAVLAVERYHAVVKPMKRWMRLKDCNLKYIFGAIWLTGIICTIPMFINGYYREHSKACRYKHTLYWDRSDDRIYQIVLGCLILIPFAVIIYCYFHIVRNLYFKKKVDFGEHSAAERLRNQRKCHVAKLSLSVTFVFIVFLLPAAVVSIMKYFNDSEVLQDYFRVIAILFLSEAGINPFLYAFQSTNFRQAFKDVLRCS